MPVIDAKGHVLADSWVDASALETVPSGDVILSSAQFESYQGPGKIGLRVGPATAAAAIVPNLGKLALIAIEFPKFRDGRGFSLARSLREHHGYTGDIRAVGHFVPDQFRMLVQCGFSSAVVPDAIPLERWSEAVDPSGAPQASGQLLMRVLARGAEGSTKAS